MSHLFDMKVVLGHCGYFNVAHIDKFLYFWIKNNKVVEKIMYNVNARQKMKNIS
jgi:hypothetical protein